MPGVEKRGQPRYAENKGCSLWPSYEGTNNWKIFQLVPKIDDDRNGVGQSNLYVLDAIEARISLITDDVYE